jgi:large subunit ribosomal protein L18
MKSISQKKEEKRAARHKRVRKSVVGTTGRPRLCVHRSLKNFYAQIVDDSQGKIIFGASTLNKDVRSKVKYGGNIAGAKELGAVMAGLAKKSGVTTVCFDRGGYMYHGRVKAFADAARENGLEF